MEPTLAHLCQHSAGSFVSLFPAHAGKKQWKGYIPKSRIGRDKVERLKYHADLIAPVKGQFVLAQLGYELALHFDIPR